MNPGRPAIRLFVANALLVALVLAGFWRFVIVEWEATDRSWSLGRLLFVLALLALASAGASTFWATRLQRRRVQRAVVAARRIADGNVATRVALGGDEEIDALARSLNEIRATLTEQAGQIDHLGRLQRSLLSQIREGVIVVDGNGRVVLINHAAVRLLNLPTRDAGDGSEHLGQVIERCIPQHDLQVMLRVEPARAAEAHPPRGRPGETPRDQDLAETRLQIDSARGVTHVLARASDFVLPQTRGATGATRVGRLLVLTDVTELTRSIQVKTEFVSNASHELRTPLSTIRAAVETLLETDAGGADTARKFIDIIDRHSARLQAVVSDLLDLARLESPAARFEPRPLEIAYELDDLHSRFIPALNAKRIEWDAERAPGTPERMAVNPQLLRLTLDNLVDNAIKFTEPDGSVRVTVRGGPNWISFEVADTGCGIPEEEQERVFERFYQVERARSGAERGTGLGLAIVRHAVSAMNGSVTLQSAPGRGTRVTVTVPQEPPDERLPE